MSPSTLDSQDTQTAIVMAEMMDSNLSSGKYQAKTKTDEFIVTLKRYFNYPRRADREKKPLPRSGWL